MSKSSVEKVLKLNSTRNDFKSTDPEKNHHSSSKRSFDDSEEDDIKKDEFPKKKIAFGLSKPKNLLQINSSSITLKLGKQQQIGQSTSMTKLKPKAGATALAFNQHEDDDDEEEMPPEARMRMKNIGRDTPTSSGPNSFGKSRMGFCDSKKVYERKLKELQDDNSQEN